MKKINKIILFFSLSFFVSFVYAQHKKVAIDPSVAQKCKLDIHPKHSSIQVVPLGGSIKPTTSSFSKYKHLISFRKDHEINPEIERIKKEKTEKKKQQVINQKQEQQENGKSSPNIATDFEGNWFDGYIPPDNSMAISDGGFIVSVINSNIDYYDEDGNFLSTLSFDNFFDDDNLTSNIYDPVVLYDDQYDRFILVVLHGTSSSTSKVLVCFSKSNNPYNDGWWFYYLTGNPLDNGCWFDYPKIAISNEELYVSGNLFSDNDNFQEATIYQIDKVSGYSGGNISWTYWYNISESPFTLLPVSYGQAGNYGPGIYLVSSDENGILTDKYRLYDLTDYQYNNPDLNVYSIDAPDFDIAGDALQLGSNYYLSNGDNRLLSGFYLNGIIHFVFHSERDNGYNGINYNRLDVANLSVWHSTFGLDGYDYSYPAVASYGTDANDKTVIIGFERSSSSIYPEFRVVECDNAGNWSSSAIVKAGESYVDYIPNDNGVVRWGDYTGACRRKGSSEPEVWISGSFGVYDSWYDTHAYNTWIAQIKENYTSVNETNVSKKHSVNVYPNPVKDMFSITFDVDNTADLNIFLYDMNGKVIRVLYSDKVHTGKHTFVFNKASLKSGMYFVRIFANKKEIANEKLIVQ